MNGAPKIRPARPGDAEACAQIAVDAWRHIFEHWRELLGDELWALNFGDWERQKRLSVRSHLSDHAACALVSEVHGEIVGFATWRLHRGKRVGEISNNAVALEWQGRGIGTRQIERVLAIFREEGMRSARVLTGGDAGHAAARAMYRKAGFDRNIPYVEYFMML